MRIPPIVWILLFALLAGGAYYFFTQTNAPGNPPTATAPTNTESASPPPVPNGDQAASPAGTGPSTGSLRIDGSTSMVAIDKALKIGFEQNNPGTTIAYKANGTGEGIKALVAEAVEIAAASRPLKAEEAAQGLVATPVAADEIAIVVGVSNSFDGSLTTGQLADIFAGRVTNWSQVGGTNHPLKVINRNPESGTAQFFQDVVLNGAPFGTGAHITTLSRDETTPLLRALGNNGIGYATATQVLKQKTVRVIAIGEAKPGTDNPDYPLRRNLYYVYKKPPTPLVQAFLTYAQSPEAKQAIRRFGF